MKHLTQEQRYTITAMLKQGYSQKDIAKAIEKSESTVSREIRRNCDGRSGEYQCDLAQRKYIKRQRDKPRIIKFTEEIRKIIDKCLEKKWSPEQIANTPTDCGTKLVSHERIYQYIIEDKRQGGDRYTHLRRRKKYKKRIIKEERRGKIPDAESIHKRPDEANKRTRYGDFEVDLIVGANHKGGLLTINDRRTGMVKIRKIKDKTSKHVSQLIIQLLKKEKVKIYTLTSDNGHEFANHKEVSTKLDIDVFFADPYCSWQRGSNENLNGLIRQYFPKKTNFDFVTASEIREVQNQLNNRPRKRFEYRTPIEEFNLVNKIAFAS
jgi:transposase, IS30 family